MTCHGKDTFSIVLVDNLVGVHLPTEVTGTHGAGFGFLAALMGCYYGMNSGRGAQGVGKATKSAVVAASVLILAVNYILTELFFSA